MVVIYIQATEERNAPVWSGPEDNFFSLVTSRKAGKVQDLTPFIKMALFFRSTVKKHT